MDITQYKLTTGIERAFRHVPGVRIPGFDSNLLYAEVQMHFLLYKDPNTGEVVNQKLQRQVLGQVYFATDPGSTALEHQRRSLNGEIDYTFPNGETKRLIGTGVFLG